MFDSSIHDLQMEISKLQEKKRMFDGCRIDLKFYGLEGMDFYHVSDEYEYMHDTDNRYFDIFKQSYGSGWSL